MPRSLEVLECPDKSEVAAFDICGWAFKGRLVLRYFLNNDLISICSWFRQPNGKRSNHGQMDLGTRTQKSGNDGSEPPNSVERYEF
jgi:hypothetical protein